MRIATWNLDNPPTIQNARWFALQYHVAYVYADIWVMTETHCSFAPVYGYRSVSTEPDHDSHTDQQRWTMIWSRHPIERLDTTSDPTRAVAAMVKPKNGKPLLVYGTVLPWAGSKWGGKDWNSGEAFREAIAAQANDWKHLCTRYTDADLCVVGDFNQVLTKTPYYSMGENYSALIKSLEDCNLQALTEKDDPVKRIDAGRASIDHICISLGSTRLPATSVVAWDHKTKEEVFLSDHFGVYVDLAD